MRYEIAGSVAIPAFNFYPCLVKGLSLAAERGLRNVWADLYSCTDAGVQFQLVPDTMGVVTYRILKDTLQALSITFGKFEVPSIIFAAYSGLNVKATGRVYVVPPSTTF